MISRILRCCIPLLLLAMNSHAVDPQLFTFTQERVVVGSYDFGEDQAADESLALFIPASGEIATLIPESPGRYTYRGGELEIQGDRIRWRRGSELKEGDRSTAVRHENVRFGVMTGRLTLPATGGPHPVLVMVHGAGRGSRDYAYYGLFAAHLAGYGLGVLTYDKRDDWRNASVEDLAVDAIAAVDYLRGRHDIDRSRVGMFGHSQGGWIAPLVAARRKIAFLSVFAAPAVSTWSQELDEATNDLRARGFSEADILEAHAALDTMFRVVDTGEGVENLRSLVTSLRTKPWAAFVDLSAEPADLAYLRRSAYDPRETLESLRIPILAMFGERDEIVPPSKNVPLWKKYAQHATLDVDVVPGANHGLLVSTAPQHGHGDSGGDTTKQFGPTVIPRLTNWLLATANCGTRFAPGANEVDFAGTYATAADETIVIQQFGPMFMLVDFARGRTVGFAKPEFPGQEMPLIGHGQQETPVRIRVVREESSHLLHLGEEGVPDRIARKVDLHEEEACFNNGAVRLCGTLVVPAGPGPHPSVVFAHGTGPSTRFGFLAWARLFARNGIAALAFDKRGTGNSSGELSVATFQDLASDLSQAVHWLESRADVRNGVGVIGTSQGPWIAAIAAEQNFSIAFIIASSGGPLGPAEQERYRRLRKIDAAGFGSGIREKASETLGGYFGFLTGRVEAASITALWVRYAEEPWFKQLVSCNGEIASGVAGVALPDASRRDAGDAGHR